MHGLACKASSISLLALCSKRLPSSDPLPWRASQAYFLHLFLPFHHVVAVVGFTATTASSEGFTLLFQVSVLCSLPGIFFSALLAVFSHQPLLFLRLLFHIHRTFTFVNFCCLPLPHASFLSLRLHRALISGYSLSLLAGTGLMWPDPVFDNKDYRLPLVSFLTTFLAANNSFTCVTCLPFLKDY